MLLRRVPAVFGGNALYATVAVAASVVMVVASSLGSPSIGILVAILLSLLLRWGAVRRGWGLPNGRNWQPQSRLASLLRRGRGRGRGLRAVRPGATRLLRRPGRRAGAGSVHTGSIRTVAPGADVPPAELLRTEAQARDPADPDVR
jgi:hypothetical protein